MKAGIILISASLFVLFIVITSFHGRQSKRAFHANSAGTVKRYLYVAVPGIRDYMGYGGHGILVFDMDDHCRFVKRIATGGFHPDKTPSNVKGIAVSVPLN